MKSILLIFLGLLLTSCNDFLEVELPKDQITADLIFKDDQLAKSAMAGIYRSIEDKGFLTGSSMGIGAYMGCYADELTAHETTNSNLVQLYRLTLNPQSNLIKTLWNDSYSQIYAVNRMIEGLSASENLSADIKGRLDGEAYFLRAFLHFYLTQSFGDIPYIRTTDYRINAVAGKVKADDALQMALEDLGNSERLLPEQLAPGARVRPTRMAVYALKSRIYLYLKDWDQAIFYSSKVIASSSYAPETDLSKTFRKESRSSIWQLEPAMAGSNTRQGLLFILMTAPPSQLSLSNSFVNSFEPQDQRKASWIGTIKDAQQHNFYFPYKYKQNNVTATTQEHSIVLRVEEQYLIRAESYFKKQMIADGLADINLIRNRAGLPSLTNNGGLTPAMAVLNERNHELFTEFGHRFYDLKRSEELNAVMQTVKTEWKPGYQNFPLPESELLLNPNLLPQNVGY